MQLSVVISTYNQPEWLRKVLWGFACQTLAADRYELVIADDGSGDETRAVLAHASATHPARIRHVWHEDSGFRKSEILNKAIAESGGDYLVFTDGDCIPRRDFLEVHAQRATRGRFLSGGYVKLSMQASHAIAQEQVEDGSAFDARWLRRHGMRSWLALAKLVPHGAAADLANMATTTRPTWNGHNASGWKCDVVAVNGFDERMQYGGQDRELGERLENAGVRGMQIRYSALCVHLDHARGYRTDESLQRNRGIRRDTRMSGRNWTEYGIRKGARDAAAPSLLSNGRRLS